MSTRNSCPRLLGGALLICLVCLAAAPPTDRPDGARREDLTQWASYFDVKLDRKADRPKALYDFILTPEVFGASSHGEATEDRWAMKKPAPPEVFGGAGLGDLRLIDKRGQPVPYALRVRNPVNVEEPLKARAFDQVVNADHSVALSLDLGENPGEYDQMDVRMPGSGFIRALRVEASNDRKNWSKVLDNVHVARLDEPGERLDQQRRIDQHRFRIAPARFRYLRVQVWPDRGRDNDRPEFQQVQVLHTVQAPGEDVTRVADLGRREPVRFTGQPASAWVIDLGAEYVPCRRLTLRLAQTEFSRPFQLEAKMGGRYGYIGATSNELRPRQPGSDEAVIELAQEIEARYLRLTVTDAGNPPLTIEEVRCTAAARQMVFALPSEVQLPLRLYAGNPQAGPPNYDFAANLPVRLDPPPARGELGERQANPVYEPPPLPWTERWPRLVDAILGGACLVLLLILGVLARHAIRRHDAAPQPPAA
jgi:hypothetical protein